MTTTPAEKRYWRAVQAAWRRLVASTVPRNQLALEFAVWGVSHSPQIHYAEIRPIPLAPAHHFPRLPFTTDCSGFVTMCYRYSGAPDPNGRNYDGQGYTGTLLAHGRHIPLVQVRRGDLVVYGCRSIPVGHHVGIVKQVRARDPAGIVTVSHGNEGGPLPISVAAEAAGQPDGLAGVIYLRFPWR